MAVEDPTPGRARDDPDSTTNDHLRRTAELAIEYRGAIAERRVGPSTDVTSDGLRRALGGPLPRAGTDARAVVEALVQGVGPGLTTISGPRYFGFVTGGSLPAALATDWLTSTWDQNAVLRPGVRIINEVVLNQVLVSFG